MKRSSRRPRRSSRSLRPNRSVEQQTFGKEIDPDAIDGARGKSLDGAMSRFEIFQQKAPQMVVRVEHDAPSKVVPVGDCTAVMYRSSKWHDDGADEDYKHLHDADEKRQYAPGKGPIVYENAKFATAALKRNNGIKEAPRVLPEAWARLGYCLGFFVRKEDGELYESNPRNTWLLATPDGHMLAIYSPRPQSNGDVGFLCLIAGGKLRTLKEGIDG